MSTLNTDKGDEIISLKMTMQEFVKIHGQLEKDKYEIKTIEPFNEEYPDDPTWVQLKKESRLAYKKLKDYEFDKRNI